MANLGDWIHRWTREGVGQAISDNERNLKDAAANAGDHTALGMGNIFSEGVGGLLTLIDPVLGVAAGVARWVGTTGQWVRSIAEGWALGSFVSEGIRPIYLPILHAIADAEQTEIFDPNTAAHLVAKQHINHQEGRSEAAGGNLSGDHFDRLVDAAYTIPGLAELLDLYRRGLIDQNALQFGIGRAGVDPHFAGELAQLARVLLSPADLALANLRGELDDATMVTLAGEMGVSEFDIRLLVGNTGEPPGPQELLEAYRRGFIDTPRLERGIKQSRVRNEWIDVIEKLRLSPMSTADALRAVVENHLSEDEGKSIANQNGLEPEHWTPLLQSWGRPLAHMEMASLVHRGLASREQFDQAMRESDIKNKYVEQSFQVATRLIPERQIVSGIRFGALSLAEGSKLLLQQGYSEESAAVLLKLGLREQHHTTHELTKQQIVTLYSDGILPKSDAHKHLEALGFTSQDAGYMLQIADYQAHAKEMRQETAATRAGYLAGNINKINAEHQLTQAGVTRPQALHLLELWDREKHRASRVLSPAQAVKAAKNEVITAAEATNLLVAAGYTAHDAAILLETSGVSKPK